MAGMPTVELPTLQLTSEAAVAAVLVAGCAAAPVVRAGEDWGKSGAAGWQAGGAGLCPEVAERSTAELQGSHSHEVCYEPQDFAVSAAEIDTTKHHAVVIS